MDLFDTQADHEASPAHSPLAERTRPRTLEEFVGQEHLVGEGKALQRLIEMDQVPSMLRWPALLPVTRRRSSSSSARSLPE